jgi:hypothetical protein
MMPTGPSAMKLITMVQVARGSRDAERQISKLLTVWHPRLPPFTSSDHGPRLDILHRLSHSLPHRRWEPDGLPGGPPWVTSVVLRDVLNATLLLVKNRNNTSRDTQPSSGSTFRLPVRGQSQFRGRLPRAQG